MKCVLFFSLFLFLFFVSKFLVPFGWNILSINQDIRIERFVSLVQWCMRDEYEVCKSEKRYHEMTRLEDQRGNCSFPFYSFGCRDLR